MVQSSQSPRSAQLSGGAMKTTTAWPQVATGEVLSYRSSQTRSDDTPVPCLRHLRHPMAISASERPPLISRFSRSRRR
jgi:hypothetical protein